MISSPNCYISKQISNKACINNICTLPAFICKYCQDDECQHLHYHDNKLEVARWSQIIQLTRKIEVFDNSNKWFSQTIDKLQKQINKLVNYVNSIIQIYTMKIKQCHKSIKLDPQFQRVWDNVKQEKWDLITGRQIRMIYDKVKQDNFITNKEDIKVMKDKEIKNALLLLDDINEKLNEYKKNDIVVIPKHLTKEDQQQLKKYNQEIKKNPINSIAYYNRGLFYENRNQQEKALSDYNKAIQCDPKNSLAYYYRGSLYDDKNQFQNALSDYNKAIQFDPKYTNTYVCRGLFYKNKNQLEKALSDYNKAIECDPKNSLAYNNRGVLYEKRNQLQNALADYTKAIKYSQNVLYYSNRALVYRKLNKIKEAKADQKKCDELRK